MGSRIKKRKNAINNSSSTIENNIPSKQNDNFDRANFFNGLVYKDIMAVENKELNVYKKSEVPVTKNNIIAKNTLLSDKSPTLCPSECTRDTTDWLPPGMVLNKNTSFTVSDVSDVIITCQKPSCSRELFKIPSIESDNKTSSSDLECNDVVIVDELTQIGKSGLKKPKIINKKMKEKHNRVHGNGKKVQNNPCAYSKCPNKCTNKITEEERQIIFSNFWGLGSYERQRDYLLKSTKEIAIKRKRVEGTSRRNVTREYYLSCNSEPKRVCQQFLLKTLDMTQNCLNYTLLKRSPSGTSKKDGRGSRRPKNKTSDDVMANFDKFIQQLPAVPSHYCRASTTKKYLPSELGNCSRLYKLYIDFCKQSNGTIIKKTLFNQLFKEKYNIGFHVPKKDKCTWCCKIENIIMSRQLNESEDTKNQLHLYEKEECKSMFLFDQQISKCKGNFLCSSFDLQKVLSSPSGQNMNLYYSRKFSSYNCTIYESGTQNAYAYLWGEINGKRGCNEIVTCIHNYLTDIDIKKIYEYVALYCDSCTGQNKNRAMLTMISKSLKSQFTYIKEIKIVFLLPGHTYMPVDSVHASIERFVRDKTVWASSEWATLIRNARINPKPIEVKQLAYSDFYNWKYEADNSDILPKVLKDIDGNIIQISEVRYFVFSRLNLDNEDDNLHSINIYAYFSYNPDCEPKTLKLKGGQNKKESRSTTEVIAKKLYKKTIAISKEKYNDLIKLCTSGIIPNEFHEEYLQMRNSTKIQDCLQETDEEDETVSLK
ncbi:unnamed protein product [Macrosiphum euphorbiae]|uniref:DUF7869 domain-containing protein n=1 Tax=Macrosiphum euphorbiae TaxID=13131 RepID=A0AAV0X3X0_9HEMI|nr:unnamed protein product [Macrosiphum euphorbiae]